ncbi:glutamate/gamma-aminobutyrate family transporter YjeM [Clostridium gelidum]|uniref:Glutamate/gamma-aminobutyrate family transporter YjeM n=1 Tax=Clostridium gelidum TaxID=704125 RepID=A0ABN6IW07_9CLOT|nr:glutamate/gamma-aminobutyrate family transporter YjeM [Clostridium gelidum]BCZ46335.1 glutamate/gamma-aminobutyrate family transporter YjeM [Clostridium gelidum]
MNKNEKQKKLTLITLILMIFTSVFGFANMPRSFYLMGYGAIPWFILGGVTFFIPFAFMMAEYGSAFKEEKGGIYSWMEKSVGPKFAFIGVFMWYASYVVWMINICSTIWIPLSNTIFGVDTTSSWGTFGLSSTQVLGILGVIWVCTTFLISKRGITKITKITSVGGMAVALLNILLIIVAVIVFILNKGQFKEPITSAMSFINSPNPSYHSIISMLSFLVFALFAYGGIEAASGLVDQTENPEKTFPKGILIAAAIISIGYSLGIFLIGIFTNWATSLSGENINMANVAYVVMNNLGYTLGNSMGLSDFISIQIGNWVARFVGLSMFLAITGAFFTLSYAPLKQLIEGTPAKLWPGKMASIDKNDMPINAMAVQTTIVAVMVLFISMGGKSAKVFFEMLVLMTNVAMTLPYLFLTISYISFRKKDSIEKPFLVVKNKTFAIIMGFVVTAVVGFANLFTIIEPAIHGNYTSTIAMIAGPLIFIVAAVIIYANGEKK